MVRRKFDGCSNYAAFSPDAILIEGKTFSMEGCLGSAFRKPQKNWPLILEARKVSEQK